MNTNPALLIHPTKRHPLTGEPLQAVYIRDDGRVFWPVIGAAPDGGDGTGAGGDGGSGGGSGGSSGANGGGNSGGGGNGGTGGAGGSGGTDSGDGKDLGFPKDTPVAEMTDKQAAAYHKHQSRKHENRYKDLLGGRSADDIKRDLDAYAEIQKQQQTPAEQALTAARDEGKNAGIKTERQNSARALFKGALELAGVTGDRLDTLTTGFNPDAFIGDNGVDTTKLTGFVKELVPAGTANQQRRDFGGGNRDTGGDSGRLGSRGHEEARRRGFIKDDDKKD